MDRGPHVRQSLCVFWDSSPAKPSQGGWRCPGRRQPSGTLAELFGTPAGGVVTHVVPVD